MLILQDIDENIGGLEVIPDTHTDEVTKFMEKNLAPYEGDFKIIPKKLK